MTIVDTHCHTGLHKYEPVEFLLHHMDNAKVSKAVLIQYGGNTDNTYLVDCLTRYPGQLAAAMIVEPNDDGTSIRQWHAQGLSGIRLPVNSRAQATDPLIQWRTAAELGLVVSAPCTPTALLSEQFTDILRNFPQLQIVIEHLAGIGPNASPPYDEFKQVLALARFPNLTIKLPGFGEFCSLPHPFAEVPPFARMALEAFGPQRMMWGSDYPPVSSREGYTSSLHFPLAYFSDLSPTEQAWIFGRTALETWKLS